MDAYGQVTAAKYGNDVTTAWTHDARMGRLTDVDTTHTETVNNVETTTMLQDNTYAWRSDGILLSRMTGRGATPRTETFGYDLLNRMTSAALTVGTSTAASRTLGYSYDRLGNVTGRDSSTETNLESTVYGADGAGPNALTTATYGTGTAAKEHTLTYDAGGRVIEHIRRATTRPATSPGTAAVSPRRSPWVTVPRTPLPPHATVSPTARTAAATTARRVGIRIPPMRWRT